MTVGDTFQRGAAVGGLVIGLLLGSTPRAAGQEPQARERKNSIYLELGPGLSSTTNYERSLAPKITVRLGIGTAFDYVLERVSGELLGMADFAVWSSREGRHQVIAGVGAIVLGDLETCPSVHSPGLCRDGKAEWILNGEIGYRYRSRSGFLLRATLARSPNPSDHYTDHKRDHLVLPALSLGWSF